jgi:hypothetical protein
VFTLICCLNGDNDYVVAKVRRTEEVKKALRKVTDELKFGASQIQSVFSTMEYLEKDFKCEDIRVFTNDVGRTRVSILPFISTNNGRVIVDRDGNSMFEVSTANDTSDTLDFFNTIACKRAVDKVFNDKIFGVTVKMGNKEVPMFLLSTISPIGIHFEEKYNTVYIISNIFFDGVIVKLLEEKPELLNDGFFMKKTNIFPHIEKEFNDCWRCK